MSDNFYIYSDFSMRCIRQTTRGCSSYRSSRAGWRLVAVEVVDLLLAFAFCGCQVADLCQGFVCTVMPYVGIGSFMWATACLLLGVGSSERQNPCVCIPHTLRQDWRFHVVYCLLIFFVTLS